MKLIIFLIFLIFLILFSISSYNYASTNSNLTTGTSTGIGMQYSLVGAKHTIYRNKFSIYAAIGLGVSGGVETVITSSNKLTFAVGAGIAPFVTHYSTNLNYHFSGYRQDGWLVGIEVGQISVYSDVSTTTHSILTVSGGYKFW